WPASMAAKIAMDRVQRTSRAAETSPRSLVSSTLRRRSPASAASSVTSMARSTVTSAAPCICATTWAAQVAIRYMKPNSSLLLRASQPNLCYRCHQEVRADFSKPFRHRINEGLLECTDCHNVHGGFLTRQLRATAAQDTVCFRCHTDKAGPFVFEHVPVKTEGCTSCHTPHGSVNPRLLKRAQVNVLCLECHTLTVDSAAPGIPSFHNQAQKYQACTMCHVSIHGSNFSEVFFK